MQDRLFPRAIGEFSRKLTGRALGRRGFTEAALIEAWPEIVGQNQAAGTMPLKISFEKGERANGTLHVRVATGGLATELHHREPLLLQRINAHFGYGAVARLKITQGPVTSRRPPRRAEPAPILEESEEILLQKDLDRIDDPELRATLERLGRQVLRRAVIIFVLLSGGASAADKPWPTDEVLGKPDAPITIIEYSSLTCSHCAHFNDDTLPRVKKEWLDTGRAKLIMRDIFRNDLDRAASMISHCSGDRYFTFVDSFFHNQGSWSQSDKPLEALKSIARLGGMSGEEVDRCLRNQPLLSELNQRQDDAIDRYAVDATPTFVIDGTVTKVSLDYDGFAKALKERSK